MTTIVFIIVAIAKKRFDEGTFIQIAAVFLYSASFISGLHLSFITTVQHLNLSDLADTTVSCTILGGLALSWIAMWEVIKRFRDVDNAGAGK